MSQREIWNLEDLILRANVFSESLKPLPEPMPLSQEPDLPNALRVIPN